MRSAMMVRATILVALAILGGRRQATPAEVGEQSTRDAQGMAIMAASRTAAAASPDVVPEASKRGAVQQAPSRLR
jgi:hypothetical protein